MVVFFLAVGQYLVSLEIRKLNLACLNIYSNNIIHRNLRIIRHLAFVAV